jgi:hypothetical protein
MNTKKLLFAALGVVATSAAVLAQDVFDYSPTGSNEPISAWDVWGDSSNVEKSQAATASYNLAPTVTVDSATLTAVNSGTYGREFFVALSNSAAPGLAAYFNLNDVAAVFTASPIITTNASRPLSGPLVGSAITSGSTWYVEFFESFDDLADSIDSTATNLKFTTANGTVPALPATDVNFSFAGPIDSIDAAADLSNPVLTGPSSAGLRQVTGVYSVRSASYTQVQAGDWPSDTQARIRNSAFPTSFMDIPIFRDASYDPQLLIPGSNGINVIGSKLTGTVTGTLVTALVPNASTYTVEIYNGFADGLADTAEATISNLDFGFQTITPPSASQTFTINGASIDLLGDPSNTIINLGTHSGPAYVVDTVRYESGSISMTGTTATEARILLRNSSNPYLSLVITPYTSGGSQSVLARSASLAFPAYQASPLISTSTSFYLNLYGQTIPTGSTWTAELFETANTSGSLDVAEATHTNLVFSLLPSGGPVPAPPATGTAPASFTDLGMIDSTTAPVATPISLVQDPLSPAGTVRWYKFSIPRDTDYTNFIDIWGTTNITTPAQTTVDTEFALYDNTGVLRATDDDDSVALMSQLSIGGAAAPRAASPATTLPTASAGSVFSGIDASATIQAGTYWLAVTHWNANFNHGFVTLPSTSINASTWRLNLRTNMAPAPKTISGNLELLSTVGSGGTESIGWTLSDGTNTYNGNVSVADVGSSAYSIAIPGGAPNGNYTLKFKGGTFLSKTLNVTLTGSSLTGQDAALKNGDIDQDTEVGPGDFEAVVAQFGAPGDADVDNDGEVGPSDFETVVANFGLGDE